MDIINHNNWSVTHNYSHSQNCNVVHIDCNVVHIDCNKGHIDCNKGHIVT
jgi:hypothetical protein